MTTAELGNNLIKVTLTGRLDTPGVDRIETRFFEAIVPGGHHAIVDLTGVEFVTSMGIRMFIAAARGARARNARLALFAPQPLVREVFDNAALQQLIDICPNEAAALAAITTW
jgi:anti-anti-sigma factor